jgi:V8-like Glu-specific endopeptidase
LKKNKQPTPCILFDARRLNIQHNLINAEVLGSKANSNQDLIDPEWTLLVPQRSRYMKCLLGACTAIPLQQGNLLTAGHCIRAEHLPGTVLDANHIAAAVWVKAKLIAADGCDSQQIQLNSEQLWTGIKLLNGQFKTDGPDWALLSSVHNLPAYRLAEQAPGIGETCHISGYPLGLSLRHVASGEVIPPIRENEHFFWLNCQISNGVSGAPVSNQMGELVGIACGNTTTDDGMYTRVQKIPEELKHRCRVG